MASPYAQVNAERAEKISEFIWRTAFPIAIVLTALILWLARLPHPALLMIVLLSAGGCWALVFVKCVLDRLSLPYLPLEMDETIWRRMARRVFDLAYSGIFLAAVILAACRTLPKHGVDATGSNGSTIRQHRPRHTFASTA